MNHKEYDANCTTFVTLCDDLMHAQNHQLQKFLTPYVKLNINLMNDILSACIKNLSQLKKIPHIDDVMRIQIKQTQDMVSQLTQLSQQFLNMSLNQIADYNDWIKKHEVMAD